MNFQIDQEIIRGNSVYTIVDGPSWEDAETNANNLGGNLVTINDKEENAFLSIFDDGDNKWIGLNDFNIEGQWQWSSDEDVTFTAWDVESNQPDNHIDPHNPDGQDFVSIDWERGVTNWDDKSDHSVWNLKGIAEIPFIQRGNSAYVLVEGPSWSEAEVNANKLGGHLVTINDAEENQWLVDNFPHETSWYTYWIGLNDATEDNVYQWSSGENFNYNNWRPTSGPNRDSEDKSSDGPSYVEFQVNDLNESQAGEWNDHPPLHNNSPKGIAEITIKENEFKKEWSWSKRLFDNESLAYDISIYNDKDFYLTGFINGNIDNEINSGGKDAFLAKLDKEGNRDWVRLLGTSNDWDQSRALINDKDGNVYIAGELGGSLNNYDTDIFVAKYTSEGKQEWYEEFKSPVDGDDEYVTDIKIGIDNSIYVSGYTGGDFEGVINNNQKSDSFIIKLNEKAEKEWVKLIDGDNSNGGFEIGKNGNIYLGGSTSIGFDDQVLLGTSSAYITSINTDNGETNWTRIFEGDHISGLTIDDENIIFTAGYYGSNQVFLNSFNDSGETLWEQKIDNSFVADDLIEGKDGLLYLSARSSANGPSYIANFDKTGTQIWREDLPNSIDINSIPEYLSALVEEDNGEFYFSGMKHNPEEGYTSYISKLTIKSPSAYVGAEPDPILYPVIPSDSEITEGAKFGYQLVDENGEVVNYLAVMGNQADKQYTLEITGETLYEGFNLESLDLTVDYESSLFNAVDIDNDVTISSDFTLKNSVDYVQEFGELSFSASSLSELGEGSGIGNETDVIASIQLDFNEEGLAALARNEDGSFVDNPFGFEITANLNDTVLSRNIDDGTGFLNRQIYSLNQFGGDKFSVEGTDVFLYEQKAGLLETGDGLIISTDRVIGADAAETNLVRSGDTLTASTSWINTGNTDLVISDVAGLKSDANAVLRSYGLSQETLLGGTYGDGGFISSADELTLTADITITGDAGSVVDLGKSIFEVSATGIDESFSNSKGTKNLITYQGDLNYDGRVSMKDLAYLNAGAAKVNSGGEVASDVDANFDAKINIEDLAVLDKDWGKTLHDGRDEFLGSNDLSWEEIDNQGSKEWNNAVFKEQNAFEAYDGFVGSLESPTSNVIGADGNTNALDDDMLGTNFQEFT